MKPLGWTIHALCVVAVFLGIWVAEYRFQFLGTAIVLLILGALILGTADMKAKRRVSRDEVDPTPPTEFVYKENRRTFGRKEDDQ